MTEVFSVEEARFWFTDQTEPVKCVARTAKHVCANLQEAEAFFVYMAAPVAATNEIKAFLHCGLCLKEKPADVSPSEWARLEVGWTPHGIQVWCRRHEANVIHIDFEGRQHPANMKIHQNDLGL